VCLCFFFQQKAAYGVGAGGWGADGCASDLGGGSGHNKGKNCTASLISIWYL